MASSDFLMGFLTDFTSSAYTARYVSCGLPTHQDLSCSIAHFHFIPLSLRRRVLQCCSFRVCRMSPSAAPSVAFVSFDKLGSLLSPYGVNISTLQDSLYVTG